MTHILAADVSNILLGTPGGSSLHEILHGEPWGDVQLAFQDNSLMAAALRVQRSKDVEIGVSFISMINLIQFAMKADE